MSLNPISGIATEALQMALDAASLRHQTIASNIANANTQGYQPLRVSFEAQLQSALNSLSNAQDSATQTKQILNGVRAEVEIDPTASGVAIDQQMALLTQNHVHYQALLKALNGKIELTSLAINEGRR